MNCRVLHWYVNSRISNFTANISWVFVWSFCFSAEQSCWNFLTVPPNPFLRLQTVLSWDVPVAELSCNCIASYFPTTIEVRLWIDFPRLNDPSISSSFEVVILLLLEVMELDPCGKIAWAAGQSNPMNFISTKMEPLDWQRILWHCCNTVTFQDREKD